MGLEGCDYCKMKWKGKGIKLRAMYLHIFSLVILTNLY
jgi:hypothetical protein